MKWKTKTFKYNVKTARNLINLFLFNLFMSDGFNRIREFIYYKLYTINIYSKNNP